MQVVFDTISCKTYFKDVVIFGEKMDKILETLKYVDLKFKKIQEILVKDIKKEEKCEFLSYETADILSNLNKCYDYCISMLFQGVDFSVLDEKDQKKIEKSYKYFPFSKKQLEGPLYLGIKVVKPDFFNYLSNLTDKITINAQVETNEPNTYSDLRYGMAKDIHDLCKIDKHKKPLEIIEVPNTKARVEQANGMIVEMSLLNCKGFLPKLCLPIGPHGEGYIGNSYKVSGFSQELEMFLIHRIGITKQIVKEFSVLLGSVVNF